MIRNDFIMRLIELLGVFLARVFQKIEKGDWDGAAEDIDKTSKESLGIPITIVESNQAENLIALFTSPSGPDYSRILAAAVLLDARGEVVAGAGNEVSGVILWTKAATLYRF
ncbi:MAG: hypothetical protein P1V20_18660 [Verrucomicrobiales bacterium]|nr:hypothetical protein [Verrucomicrobiales bacterium]